MSGRKSYVGKTNNPKRRLRQHNGEIAGGARYTRGDKWMIKYLFRNFPDETTALQMERTLKSKYRCRIVQTLKSSPHICTLVSLHMHALGIKNDCRADHRLREALFSLQKERFTRNTMLRTADMDIQLCIEPDAETIEALSLEDQN